MQCITHVRRCLVVQGITRHPRRGLQRSPPPPSSKSHLPVRLPRTWCPGGTRERPGLQPRGCPPVGGRSHVFLGGGGHPARRDASDDPVYRRVALRTNENSPARVVPHDEALSSRFLPGACGAGGPLRIHCHAEGKPGYRKSCGSCLSQEGLQLGSPPSPTRPEATRSTISRPARRSVVGTQRGRGGARARGPHHQGDHEMQCGSTGTSRCESSKLLSTCSVRSSGMRGRSPSRLCIKLQSAGRRMWSFSCSCRRQSPQRPALPAGLGLGTSGSSGAAVFRDGTGHPGTRLLLSERQRLSVARGRRALRGGRGTPRCGARPAAGLAVVDNNATCRDTATPGG